jgi:hypothetical protein
MANSKLLKEAIADAKAVRETAIANAKIALEEAFTPRLQSILSKKLQAEVEGDNEEEVNEEFADANNAPDEDASDIGDGDNKQPADDANNSSDLAQSNPDTESQSAEVGKEDENQEVISEEEEEVPGETQSRIEEEEVPAEDEDELDLEAIIRELEGELEEEDEAPAEAPVEEPVAEEGEEVPAEVPAEEPVAEEGEEAPAEDEIDLDEILREMGYGDDEEVTEEESEEAADDAIAAKDAELEEAYNVIKSLKKTINEVNLLNAKLLYTNKLFRSYNLTNEQKHKVVETLDRTQNVREVKLVYSTLAESMKIGGTAKKVKPQAKINESFASKPVASTAPKKEIIAESSNALAERFKQLANIK